MIRRLIFGLLLTLLLFSASRSAVRRPAVFAQGDPSSEILQLINQFRASQGLPPFEYNGLLASAAQGHANWMAANVAISHTGAGGSSPLTRAAASGFNGYVVENIVGGTTMSPRQGLIWWQNSPVHYNTLVTARYPQAGVGFATSGQQNMYVLLVGRPPGPFESVSSNRPAAQTAAPLIITPIELAEPGEDGSIVHMMRTGQALWTVAAYYDVDLAFLYLINGLTEEDILHPGDEVTVRLAEGQEPPPTPTPPLTHVVREGESAWSIALQNSIELDFLYLLNNMSESSILHPGNEVIVRLAEGQAPPPTPTPRSHHTVQSGQSLWLIAALYGLTLDQLIEINNLTAESVILQGDELLVRLPTVTPPPSVTPVPRTATPSSINDTNELLAANLTPEQAAPIRGAGAPIKTPTPLEATAANQPGQSNSSTTIALVFLGIALLAGGILFLASRGKI
jgi:LysM repeat protein